jgi:hypothetical protein
MLEISHNQHQLQMFLDTGANATVLYPSFRTALQSGELSHLHNKREKTAGVGGAIFQRTGAFVPTLSIEVLGKAIALKEVSLLPAAPSRTDRFRDGVVGMDALWGGFLLDFDAMRLEPAMNPPSGARRFQSCE